LPRIAPTPRRGRVLEEIGKRRAGQKLLPRRRETMRLSVRGYHRVLRVARTLADLDRAGQDRRLHLAEALSYRALAEDARRRRNPGLPELGICPTPVIAIRAMSTLRNEFSLRSANHKPFAASSPFGRPGF